VGIHQREKEREDDGEIDRKRDVMKSSRRNI
jgi:hypothetical protein